MPISKDAALIDASYSLADWSAFEHIQSLLNPADYFVTIKSFKEYKTPLKTITQS